MDTTQDGADGRTDDADAALEDLENADAAAAPDIAERLADSLTVALETGEPSNEAAHERDDEETG